MSDPYVFKPARARKYGIITVDYEPDGWPLKPNQYGHPGLQHCVSVPTICVSVPVWRTERRERGYRATGFFCDLHFGERHPQFAAAARQHFDVERLLREGKGER